MLRSLVEIRRVERLGPDDVVRTVGHLEWWLWRAGVTVTLAKAGGQWLFVLPRCLVATQVRALDNLTLGGWLDLARKVRAGSV